MSQGRLADKEHREEVTNSPGRCLTEEVLFERSLEGEVRRPSVQMAKLEERKSEQGEERAKGAPGL